MNRHPLLHVTAVATAATLAAHAEWTPFRIALFDSFPDAETYERQATDLGGFRFGFGTAVNKRVYGLSLTLLADGGSGFEPPDNVAKPYFLDDDFVGVKIGGFSNASCGSGLGLQLAGFGSTTDVRMTGAQIAGVLCEAQYLNGFQIAGLLSTVGLEMHAGQVGGLLARCGFAAPDGDTLFSTGAQVGGAGALCKGFFAGAQIAGLVAQVDGSVVGAQLGGAFAGCRETLAGVQLGGVFADAQSVDGLQLGCITYAETLCGVQIGVVNCAKSLSGVQIGLLNFSGARASDDFRCLPIINANF